MHVFPYFYAYNNYYFLKRNVNVSFPICDEKGLPFDTLPETYLSSIKWEINKDVEAIRHKKEKYVHEQKRKMYV